MSVRANGITLVLLGLMAAFTLTGGDAMADSKHKAQVLGAAVDTALLEGLVSNRVSTPTVPYFREHTLVPYRPKGLASFGGLAFDSELVPLEKLNEKEKLLLMGYAADITYNPSLLLWFQLVMKAYFQYGANPPDEAFPAVAGPCSAPDLVPPEARKRWLASMVSPITGKLIEVNHTEFSAGNAYVRALTVQETKDLVAKVRELDNWWNYSCLSLGLGEESGEMATLTGRKVVWGDLRPRPSVRGKHPPFLVYVKLYGEHGVLLEGLM
jgi:hypothetical protein